MINIKDERIVLRKYNTNLLKAIQKSPLNKLFNRIIDDERLLIFNRYDHNKNKKYLSVYHNGGVFATIGAKSLSIGEKYEKYFEDKDIYYKIKSEKDLKFKVDLYCKYKEEIKNAIEKAPISDERKKQQKIVENNKNNPSPEYIICDFEFSIPEKYIGKKPEIDLVAIKNPGSENPIVALIEYKCNEKSLGGKSGILEHLEDFVSINKKSDLVEGIKDGVKSTYNFLKDINVINGDDITADIKNFSLIYVFLFSEVKYDDIKSYKEKISEVALKEKMDIRISHFENVDHVVLNEKALIKASDF